MNKSERLRYQQGTPKEVQKLLNKYSKLQKPADEEKRKLADAQKEKLLEFDRNSVKRTQVIDDQADYFSTDNPWLSEEEKKAVKSKQQEYLDAKSKLRRRVNITIDFAGMPFQPPVYYPLTNFHERTPIHKKILWVDIDILTVIYF